VQPSITNLADRDHVEDNMAALVPTTMWMRHCTTVIFLQLFKFGHDFVRQVTDINFGPGLAWNLRPSSLRWACMPEFASIAYLTGLICHPACRRAHQHCPPEDRPEHLRTYLNSGNFRAWLSVLHRCRIQRRRSYALEPTRSRWCYPVGMGWHPPLLH
jgi:hypothetical protein